MVVSNLDVQNMGKQGRLAKGGICLPNVYGFRKMLVEELGNLVRFTDSVFYLPGFLVSVVFSVDNINSTVLLVLYIRSLFHGCK